MKYTLYFSYTVGREFEAEPHEICESLHGFLEGFFQRYALTPVSQEAGDATDWIVEVDMPDDSVAQAFGPAIRQFIEELVDPFPKYQWIAGNYKENAQNDFIYILYDIDHRDKVCITFVPIPLAEEIEDGAVLPGICE